MVVLALIVGGLVALWGDGDEHDAVGGDSPATGALVSDRPVIPAEALYSLSGYSFADLPAGSLEAARQPFDAVPELQGMLSDLSGRTLRRDDNTVAAVLIYQFTATFMSEPSRPDAFFKGITRFAAEAQEVDVGGEHGVYYRVRNTLRGLAMRKGNVVLLVQGPLSASRSQLQPIAVGLLRNIP